MLASFRLLYSSEQSVQVWHGKAHDWESVRHICALFSCFRRPELIEMCRQAMEAYLERSTLLGQRHSVRRRCAKSYRSRVRWRSLFERTPALTIWELANHICNSTPVVKSMALLARSMLCQRSSQLPSTRKTSLSCTTQVFAVQRMSSKQWLWVQRLFSLDACGSG